ncbi:MAG: hypothetical protein ACRD88_00890 [Terriglobia bacterium]
MYFLTRDQEAIPALDANGENIHAPGIVCVSLIEHPQIPNSQFPGCQRIRAEPFAVTSFLKRLILQLFPDGIPEDRSMPSGQVCELILR